MMVQYCCDSGSTNKLFCKYAVCLNNASSFLSFICANAFSFHALSLFISFF